MLLKVFCTILIVIGLSVEIAAQQHITQEIRRIRLGEALELMQKVSDYRFFYNNNHIPVNTYVSITPGTVKDVVESILKPLQLRYRILNNNIVIIEPASSASIAIIHVRGTIRSMDGVGIPSVSVTMAGLNKWTTSDEQGNYHIEAPEGTVLLFSRLGFRPYEIMVQSGKTYDVVLETDAKGIDEVIVVGFGTQKRFTNLGSVSTISREEVLRTPSASLQNALVGKLPGFFSQQHSGMPGLDGAQFFVRGVSTFTGNQQPLILVDDIEYSYDQFSSIAPNVVESISILKDAATTAVYGIKGANGVVLVTTRRGKEGPSRINVSTEYGLQKPTHVPKFLNAYQTATLRNEALEYEGKPLEFSEKSLAHFRDGTDPYGHPDIDWYKTLFRPHSPMSTTNFDIIGGGQDVQYMVSLQYLRQNGMLRDFSLAKGALNNQYYYNRYNFRSNLDVKANRSLSLRLDISGNFGERNNPYFHGNTGAGEIAAFTEVTRFEFLTPYMYPIYNPDGSWGYANPNRMVPFGLSNNIIGRIAHGGYTRTRQNLLNFNLAGTQRLDALIEGLAARGAVSLSNTNSSQRQIIRRDFPSFYYNPEDGSYTPRDPNMYRILPWETTYNGGSPGRQVNLQINLTYNRRFGDHQTSALLLFNQTSKTATSTDPLNNYIPDNFRGYTIRVGYDYKQKYLLELNAGYNGTDKFVYQNRYGLFPAISIGWNAGEERFVNTYFPFVDLFKLRASYGVVGSDDIGGYPYAYEEVYLRNSPYSFGETHNEQIGITEGPLGNHAITWERERKANLGLDFSFFRGKLSGTLDVFYNYRYDILTLRNNLPFYYGIARENMAPVNIGEVSNRGYEVELHYRTRFDNFGLDIKGNYSFARNKILEMDEPEAKYPWMRATGRPLGMVRQWIFDGFYTQAEIDAPDVAKPVGHVLPGYLKYRDINGDGAIDMYDKVYMGYPNLHNTTIGLNLGLSYRRFSLYTLWQAAVNFDVQVGQSLSTPWSANLQPFHLKRWTPETAETAEFPVLITDFRGSYMSSAEASTFWIVRGDYLRLRSLEFSYRLPTAWAERLRLDNMRLYANSYNLLTWSKTLRRFQYDPEVTRGANMAPYPQQAIYNLGMALSF